MRYAVASLQRVSLLAALAVAIQGFAADPRLDAPNVVPITARLVTSGQPSPQALARLGELGYQAVIYLAPSTVPDAVAEEPGILSRQGIEFVHVPIPFGSPEEKHYLEVSEALKRLHAKKVLVHCQVNMRASSMVFLHRVLHGKEDPEKAYESVAQVWSPGGPWRKLLLAQLSKATISFEPY